MATILELAVDKLLLDKDNPRLVSAESQPEALGMLIKRKPSHFRNIMLSIKEDGLDPGDSFYVIKAGRNGDYIVLDGNRRLSALKVLSKPDVLSDTDVSEATQRSLRRAALGFDVGKFGKIRCVHFKNREEAEPWIYKRHASGTKGKGRINWGPTEKQRFTGDWLVLDLVDFVERNADLKDQNWESMKLEILRSKSSTLRRLLVSEPGLKNIGITIMEDSARNRTPWLNRDPELAVFVLMRVMKDIYKESVDSRILNKNADIENYFKSILEDFQQKGLKEKKVKAKAFRDINIKTQATPQQNKSIESEPKTKKLPRQRITLARPKNTFNAPDSEKGERLLREATKINANNFPISAAFILRAFIELAVNDYITNSMMGGDQGKEVMRLDLTPRAQRVVEHIVKNKLASNDDMNGFRKNILDRKSPCSIQSLNSFVHNKHQIPTPDAVRVGWDNSVPLFEAAFGKVSV